jgi:uncharacterized membrane protein
MRRLLVYVAAFSYMGAGAMHFLRPAPYLKIMPACVPWHLAMVYISGAAEVAGGVGLLIPALRRAAAWGLVALLIAVFPANVNMALHEIQVTQTPISTALLWARLPLQGLLIWWLLWCTNSVRPVSAVQ